jgi:phosphoglycolate phosphatase-like HAD superfamily hydrolase
MKAKYILFLMIVSIFASCKNQKEIKKTEQVDVNKVTSDPLSSWNEGKSKQAIIDFVTKTTTEGSPDFVPLEDRIACFDNDGTLWGEQPMYFQMAFAIDQVKLLAPQHPEWKTTQPFKAILEGDMKTALSGGEKALLQIMMASHTGMSTDAYEKSVSDWIAIAKHPVTKKNYNEMIYQPMVELLDYLRANGYKTFIVSGGGIDFMRVWAEKAYGIPPYQVVGSSLKSKYEVGADGKSFLTKLPELNFNDDKEGKPVGIHQHIGKRPVFTGGNSDGDYQMLHYTTSGSGPRFGLLVHHTDAAREVAYDRASHIGKLEKGLDDAAKNNWLLVDMKNDWKIIYPSEIKK